MVGGCRRVDSACVAIAEACGNEANACRLQGGRRAGARSEAVARLLAICGCGRAGPCEGDRIGGADRHHATLSNFAVLRALPRIARSGAGLLMASLTRAVVMSGDAKMRIQDFLQITRCHGVPSRAGAADAALRYRGLTPRDPVVRVQDAKFEACRIGLLAGSVHARTFGVAERCWTKSLRLFATTLTRAKLSRSVSYAPMRPLQRI
jgi:hypothetical protein